MNLKGRNFLTLKDFTPDEILYMIDLAADLKDKKKKGVVMTDKYAGKNIALIFEKQVREQDVHLKLQRMISEWERHISTRQDHKSVRKKALPIRRGYSEECLTVSNTEDTDRKSLKNLRSMQESLSGTD